jgi:hypothetical protein
MISYHIFRVYLLKKNGHDRILNAAASAWNTYNAPCVENNSINTAFLLYVVQLLQKDENYLHIQMNEEYYKKQPFASEEAATDPTFCYPLQRKNKDPLAEIIRSFNSNDINLHWRSMYYKHMFHSKLNNSEIIINSSRMYIQGIYWTYAYYKRLQKMQIGIILMDIFSIIA